MCGTEPNAVLSHRRALNISYWGYQTCTLVYQKAKDVGKSREQRWSCQSEWFCGPDWEPREWLEMLAER